MVCQRDSSDARWYHLLQTLETFRSSGRHRQVKILRSSSFGRESQETPGKFSRFGLGLRTVTKPLSFPLLFSCFHGGSGGLCGWPRFESNFWGVCSLVLGDVHTFWNFRESESIISRYLKEKNLNHIFYLPLSLPTPKSRQVLLSLIFSISFLVII